MTGAQMLGNYAAGSTTADPDRPARTNETFRYRPLTAGASPATSPTASGV